MLNAPPAPRRITEKNPVARARSASGNDCIQRSRSAFDASAGIEVAARRLRRRARHERLIVIETRPRSLVDQEVVKTGAARGGLILRQIEQHRLVAGPDLAQEQGVDDFRRLDQLREHLPIGRGELRQIGADLGRREPRRHPLQCERIGHRSLLGTNEYANRACRGDCQHQSQRSSVHASASVLSQEFVGKFSGRGRIARREERAYRASSQIQARLAGASDPGMFASIEWPRASAAIFRIAAPEEHKPSRDWTHDGRLGHAERGSVPGLDLVARRRTAPAADSTWGRVDTLANVSFSRELTFNP